MKIRPLIGRLICIGGRLHVNQPSLNFSERLRQSSWKHIREQEEKQNLILILRKDSAQSTVKWIPPPQKKISVQSSEVRIAGRYFKLILWGFKTKILATRN